MVSGWCLRGVRPEWVTKRRPRAAATSSKTTGSNEGGGAAPARAAATPAASRGRARAAARTELPRLRDAQGVVHPHARGHDLLSAGGPGHLDAVDAGRVPEAEIEGQGAL